MLINASKYSLLEKIIFDLQISIPRIHPVHVSKFQVVQIITDIMRKHTIKSLKSKGLVPTTEPEQEF